MIVDCLFRYFCCRNLRVIWGIVLTPYRHMNEEKNKFGFVFLRCTGRLKGKEKSVSPHQHVTPEFYIKTYTKLEIESDKFELFCPCMYQSQ